MCYSWSFIILIFQDELLPCPSTSYTGPYPDGQEDCLDFCIGTTCLSPNADISISKPEEFHYWRTSFHSSWSVEEWHKTFLQVTEKQQAF